MTRCTATGALMTEQMATMPGVTLPCDLELGHQGAHQCTFSWFDPTVQELAEVLDPDESFDLEVDIAPASAIRQQVRNGEANRDDAPPLDLSYDTGELETIPDARARCLECGREVEADPYSTNGMRHLERPRRLHAARVA